ncbi:MAG: hypothetical protein U0350_28635 [Caldilineaceae bacterium]
MSSSTSSPRPARRRLRLSTPSRWCYGGRPLRSRQCGATARRALLRQAKHKIQLNLPPYPFFANLQSVMTEDRARSRPFS